MLCRQTHTVAGIWRVHKVHLIWFLAQAFELQDGRSKITALDLRDSRILESIVGTLSVKPKAHAFTLHHMKDDGLTMRNCNLPDGQLDQLVAGRMTY